ncbi:MAG TPA: pilus assembly protein PilM [bacterium]|nr:pilus assembly protein PilM [bacterium]
MINKCEKPIGIDISQSSVKAVCLDMNNSVDSYGIVDLPVNAGDTEIILALKKAISADCYNCDAIIGLRGLDVLTKQVTLQNITNVDDLAKAAEEHILDILPVERSEVELSWEVVSQENNEIKVILIAVPKKVLERYQRIVDGVGLHIKSFEINALALYRSFMDEISRNTLLVDIHADETNIEFYDQKLLLIDKTISKGGVNITREISRRHNISMQEAEKIKRQNQIENEDDFKQLYRPTADDLINEIEKVATMINFEYKRDINLILLTGGDFNLSDFNEYFVEKVSHLASTRVMVPRAVMVSDNIDKKLSDKLRLANAVGLALK